MNEMPRARFKESHRPLLLDRSYEIGEMTTENPKALYLLPKGVRAAYSAMEDFLEGYLPKFKEQDSPF